MATGKYFLEEGLIYHPSSSLKCVRGTGKQHPTKELRHWPLNFAVQGVLELASVVVFDSSPLARQIPRKYCYCGKEDKGEFFFQCERCSHYYHAHCVGLKEGDLEGQEYVCGYCNGKPNKDGNVEWNGPLSKPDGYERWSKPKARNIQKHQNKAAALGDAEREWKGARNWAEAQEMVKQRRVFLRGKEEEKYRKAVEKQKAGGHHIMDMAVGGHVVDAPVTEELMDFLQGVGMLE